MVDPGFLQRATTPPGRSTMSSIEMAAVTQVVDVDPRSRCANNSTVSGYRLGPIKLRHEFDDVPPGIPPPMMQPAGGLE